MTTAIRYSRAAAKGLIYFAAAATVFAQCEDKTGFAKKACEVQAAGPVAPGPGGQAKNDALTTGFADMIHIDTLPATIEPTGFTPLTALKREADGGFILVAGLFEATVQSFSLDPGDRLPARPAGYYPAPIKGRKAKIIADVLKQAELHPEVSQAEIQALLTTIVSGLDLEAMPPQVQQTAARVMSKEGLRQLQGAIAAKAMQKALLNMLNQRIAKDPKLQQQAAINAAKQREFERQTGLGQAMKDMQALNKAEQALPTGSVVVRGTWAQMPGGFFVRYLPEGYARTKVQVMVPDNLLFSEDPDSLITFDPAKYLAVYTQAPVQRLGITLRPVK
jgi:hypothetical protein